MFLLRLPLRHKRVSRFGKEKEYPMKKTIALAAGVCVALFPALAGGDSPPWKGRVEVRNGVRHVLNPRQAVEGSRTLESIVLWRCGATDDQVLFGVITDIVVDRAGNAYLLDAQLHTVHVINSDGQFVRSLGRAGEGPAEFNHPSGIALLSDTVLCVTQAVPARAVLMTVQGRAVGDHPIPKDEGTPYINGCATVDGRLALYFAQMVQRETSVGLNTTFASIDADGQVAATYWNKYQTADFANLEFDEKKDAEPVWALGPDGRFFVSDDWDSYAVLVVGSDGTPEYVIERDYDHHPRSQEEIDVIETLKRSRRISPQTKVSQTSRDIVRVIPRKGGAVWVLSSRGEKDIPQGVVGTFDVFDREGRFVREVTVTGPFHVGRDRFHLVGDLVFVVTNAGGGGDMSERAGEGATEVDETEVVCLRLGEAE